MSLEILTNKCPQHKIARLQRKTERSLGLSDKGTEGYEKMGCYKCDGFDESCPAYINPIKEYMRGLK